MEDVHNVIKHYENLDTSDFKEVEPNFIKELRQRKARFLESQKVLGLDEDVLNWLSHQDTNTKQAVNGLIKNLIQVQGTLAHG